MTTAIVFDLDGTLADAFADIAAAINLPLGRRGLPLHDVASIKSMVGDGAGKLIERAVPAGTSAEDLAAIRTEMLAHYYAHPADNAFLYDGIRGVLESLHGRAVPLAILSNKPHPMTLETCRRLDISHYFAAIQGEDPQHAPRKPDPAALTALRTRLGVDQLVMVGDGVPDGLVAQRAAVPFVACLWGTRTREQLAPYTPVAVAEQPADLAPILHDLLTATNGTRRP
jgi:phosphoglycolate phosphatase